jgi:cytidyltransferase-like protein
LNRKFKIVGLGGTFDELHKGHRALLLKAFAVGTHVQIGLCTDKFARKLRKNHKIASYEERLGELKDFLQKMGFLDKAEFIPLADPYGPAVTERNIEAIVVSRETEPAAHKINVKRKEKRLPALEIIVIDMIPAENHIAISTTRVRNGEIDREGRLLEK